MTFRRAPACCCTLAVLLAGAIPATASVNISHKCDNKFFQYEEDHPVGGNAWTYDIPPEYIPGGTSPSNAVTRLTADTRLAFTGAFDAYFRRLMASVAFGTAENTNVTVGVWGGTVWPISLQTAADWCSDAAITNIFNGRTNAWYLAANRVYAVTNAAVVVSNWVGYATNVVYVSGRPRVKIENRYDVTTTNALDTTRILARYLRDHNAMRVKVDNPIRGMMVSTGVGDLSLPIPSPWPDRRDFNLGRSASVYQEPVQIRPDDFLGWTFSDVAGPYLAASGEWQPSLVELFQHAFQDYGGYFYYFPTTWDLFGAQNSREAIARDVRDDAGIKYLEYPDVCPEEWAKFCDYMTGGGVTGGYAAMTNLVGIAFSTNTADGLSFLPSEPLTNSVRIAREPWAGTDSYLALCDTSIAGNRAMPRLRYEIESTGGVATVIYRGKAGDNWLVFHTYGVYNQLGGIDRVYEVTNDVFELVRDGNATIVDGYGSRETREERIELAKFEVGNGVTYTVYAESQVEDSGDPQYGRNYIQDPISDAKTWIDNYLRDTQYMPNDGDTFYTFYWDGDEYTMPYFAMGGPGGVSYNVRPYYADYYIQIRATNVICTVSKQIDQTTTLRAMPFDYRLASTSNSIPCLYPNPVYVEPSRGVDKIDGISPAAISAIGVSTNDVDASYFMPDTNGYYFALHSDSGLANAKRVDDFWLEQDGLLADKMGDEVADRAGANPRAPGGVLEAFAAYFDSLLTGEFNYYFAKLLRAHMAEEGVASGITFQGNWLPDMFQISNVRPSTDPGSLWDFDVTALGWNEQTSSYEPISPQPQYIRHQWHFGLLDNIHTNVASGFHPAAARGRLSGLEAVKWNFKAMHDARATNSNP